MEDCKNQCAEPVDLGITYDEKGCPENDYNMH